MRNAAAVDEQNRVKLLARHERTVSRRAHERAVRPLRQGVAHEFQTPIPSEWMHSAYADQLETPGSFSSDFDGCVV